MSRISSFVLSVLTMSLFSQFAVASKARLEALQESYHLSDPSYIYGTPTEVLNYGDFFLADVGVLKSSSKMEVGFARQDQKKTRGAGFFIGKPMSSVNDLANQFVIEGPTDSFSTLLSTENPFNIVYGERFEGGSWGVTLNHTQASTANKDVNGDSAIDLLDSRAQFTSLAGGYNVGDLGLSAKVFLPGKAEVKGGPSEQIQVNSSPLSLNKTAQFDLRQDVSLYAGYQLSNVYMYFEQKFKKMDFAIVDDSSSEANNHVTTSQLGFVQNFKNELRDIFYGAAVLVSEQQNKKIDKVNRSIRIPLLVGAEVSVLDALTIRGSVGRTILSSSGITVQGIEQTQEEDDKTVNLAAGVGFKVRGLLLDAVVKHPVVDGRFEFQDKKAEAKTSLTYLF